MYIAKLPTSHNRSQEDVIWLHEEVIANVIRGGFWVSRNHGFLRVEESAHGSQTEGSEAVPGRFRIFGHL